VFIYSHAEIVGEEFFAEYVAMKGRELPRALEKWRFEIAVVPFNQVPSWFEFFSRRPDWRCVYADEVHAVFLERNFAPEIPELAAPRKGEDFPLFSWAEVDAILDSVAQRRRPGLVKSLTRRHDRALRELRWTAFHLLRRQPSAAVGHGLAGLRDSTFPAPDILSNLVYAFIGVGDIPRALRCFEALPPRLQDQQLGARLRAAASR
jgi:hypothetical protein